VLVQAHHGSLRGQVDDASLALVDHVPGAGLGHEEARLQIDIQRGVPGVFGHIKGFVEKHHTGTVDQKIDATKAGRDAVDGALYLVKLAQVSDHTEVFAAKACCDAFHGGVAVEQRHSCAAFGEQSGARQADPGTAAGDHGAASLEIEGAVDESGHDLAPGMAGHGGPRTLLMLEGVTWRR
jgi:hypothetical protein